MRKRWIYDKTLGELVPAETYETQPSAGFFVQADSKPYQSMATGEMIEGRSAHRDHLKRHNLVEYGDYVPKPKPPTVAPGLRETLGRIVYEKLRY